MVDKAKKVKVSVGEAVVSSSVADAYKNYLYKALHSFDSNTFSPGKIISTNKIDQDIAILESKISQYHKFGFPAEEEQKSLEALKKLQENVKGKSWPKPKYDPKGIPDSSGYSTIMTAPLPASKCGHPAKNFHKLPDGSVIVRCNTCAKTWHVPDKFPMFLKEPGYGISPQTIQKRTSKTSKLTLQAGRSSVDQEFIMRMGMMSNCNVSITKATEGLRSESVALICKVCSKSLDVPDHTLVAKGNELPNAVGVFCTEHRHNPKVRETTGRVFREEDE